VRRIRFIAAVFGILLAVSSAVAVPSLREELAVVRRADSVRTEQRTPPRDKLRFQTNDIKLVGMGLIRLYQIFISSQDSPSCIFSPTCSHFGMESVERCGIIEGTLMTADRLTRCSGLARRYYSDFDSTGRIRDFPADEALW
jgi:uncharacterized protein